MFCRIFQKLPKSLKFNSRWGKYAMNASQYSFGYRYPKFCHGPCMTLSRNASVTIYHVAQNHNWNEFKLEDVLFSGIMRTMANMTSIELAGGNCQHVGGNKTAALQTRFENFKKAN